MKGFTVLDLVYILILVRSLGVNMKDNSKLKKINKNESIGVCYSGKNV